MTMLGYFVLLYLTAGLLFGVAFAVRGCRVLDRDAEDSGFIFRVMIVPGATLLWPYLLRRWLRLGGES